MEPETPSPTRPGSPHRLPKSLESRVVSGLQSSEWLSRTPQEVADPGLDFADEFAHLEQVTEFAGRVGEALGLVISRSSDRRLDVSRSIPSAQSLAVEPSAARDRVAECRIRSVAPGWAVSRSERSSLPGRVKV